MPFSFPSDETRESVLYLQSGAPKVDEVQWIPFLARDCVLRLRRFRSSAHTVARYHRRACLRGLNGMWRRWNYTEYKVGLTPLQPFLLTDFPGTIIRIGAYPDAVTCSDKRSLMARRIV